MKEVEVLFFDVSKIKIDKLLSTFNDEERLSFEKYKHELTKKEKIVSYYLKKKYVGDFYIDECGKPLSNNCYFNVSHSKGAVVFIKDTCSVGVDIELVRQTKDQLQDRIFSDKERRYCNSLTSFYEIWTKKESLVKASGEGIVGDIKSIPSIPNNEVKIWKDKSYFTKTIVYKNFVISVTRESSEEFNVKVIDNIKLI